MGWLYQSDPRNLDDLNLENELWVAAPADSKLTRQVAAYFDKLWNNQGLNTVWI